MIEFIKQGGIIIYPLIAASIIALSIILERFFYFWGIRREVPEKTMRQVKQFLKSGKVREASSSFRHSRNPVHRILKAGVMNWEKGSAEVERVMDEIKMLEFPRMERHLAMLNFIGKVSPTLGLLGTVTGMIKTFHFLSLNVESQQLAQGISEALITTAFGLTISIPTLAAYYYFFNKLEHIVKHSEKREMELLHLVAKMGENNA